MEVFATALKNPQSLASSLALSYKMITKEYGGLLTEDTFTRIKSALELGKITEVASEIQDTLKASENASLNIAVTGVSGSGKSTFINALRGIGHEEEDSANTGVVETTMMATPYEHPKYPNVKFWDLPGIGTPDFHPETYLNQVQFDRYDFFIILSASRFTTNDVKLVKEIRARNKHFYFVRTKVDADLYSERKAKPKSFSKWKILQKIRNYCRENLHNLGMSEAPVFLVSNFDLSGYNFPKLEEALLRGLPAHKRHTFLLTLPNISEAAIDRKAAALQERVWLEALKTSLCAAIPLVGHIINDIDVLDECLKQYRDDFGLDDASLLQVAEKLKRPVEEIRANIKSLDLVELIKGKNNMDKVLKLLEGFCSTAGNALGVAFHYGKSYNIRSRFIDVVAADAKRLLQDILNHHC